MRLVVLTALAVAVAVAAAFATRSPRGPQRSAWAGVACLILGVGGIVAVSEGRWQISTTSYTQLAREMTGNPRVTIVCDRLTGWLLTWSPPGRVPLTRDGDLTTTAYLDWPTCRSLNTWTADPTTPPDDETVAALGVLTHEIAHLKGIRGEGDATCWALTNAAAAATSLGAPPPVATSIQARLATATRTWPEAYQSTCPPPVT